MIGRDVDFQPGNRTGISLASKINILANHIKGLPHSFHLSTSVGVPNHRLIQTLMPRQSQYAQRCVFDMDIT